MSIQAREKRNMRNTMKKTLLKVLLTASVLSVSPVVAAESNVVYAAENDYILPDSDSRAYTYDELSNLSQDELRLAINEIYARHGRIFDAADLQNYFNSKSWYNGTVVRMIFQKMYLILMKKAM